MRLLLLFLAAVSIGAARPTAPVLPLRQNGGTWHSGHVQGIAVDRRGGYIYYSFTNLLAKYDFSGRLIGTLVGWTGHLGDLDLNAETGKIYGSLEYKEDKAFYIAIVDGARIDHVGMRANEGDIFRTVYLPEVVRDYAADLNGDGVFEGDDGSFKGDPAASPDHRYDCSGIDGVAFGPAFGRTDGPSYLTVAYGIYGNVHRADNDHQVLLQYDILDWDRYSRPLSETAPHHQGPAVVHGKFFVRTGNTRYGVQNLAYDAYQHRWFMGVYQGGKPAFPNYLLFAINGSTQPRTGDLIGVPGTAGEHWAQGALLPLAAYGLKDAATGIRGWKQKADVGLQPVGHGLFYLAVNRKQNGEQTADIMLMRFTGNNRAPFAPANIMDARKQHEL